VLFGCSSECCHVVRDEVHVAAIQADEGIDVNEGLPNPAAPLGMRPQPDLVGLAPGQSQATDAPSPAC